jgi:hypothetical protein
VQEWGLHWLAVAHLVGWTEERGCRHDKASGVSPANSLLNADRHVVSTHPAALEGYSGAALLVVLDLKARGDGGVAERLHASCRHVLALLEVEGGECTEAAQSLQRLVRDVGVAEV